MVLLLLSEIVSSPETKSDTHNYPAPLNKPPQKKIPPQKPSAFRSPSALPVPVSFDVLLCLEPVSGGLPELVLQLGDASRQVPLHTPHLGQPALALLGNGQQLAAPPVRRRAESAAGQAGRGDGGGGERERQTRREVGVQRIDRFRADCPDRLWRNVVAPRRLPNDRNGR